MMNLYNYLPVANIITIGVKEPKLRFVEKGRKLNFELKYVVVIVVAVVVTTLN